MFPCNHSKNTAARSLFISNKTCGKLIGNLGTTNLTHYTFAQKEYVNIGREALEKKNEARSTLVNPENGHKKSSKTLNFQAF